jgi:hypothetical protein
MAFSVSVLLRRVRAYVHPFALASKRAVCLRGFVSGAATPVGHSGDELGNFARPNELMVGEY